MRFAPFSALILISAPAFAETDAAQQEAQKQAACQFQAEVIGAVQKVRLDRVRKENATETAISANPAWPAGVETAVAPVVDYVYAIKRRDLKKMDLAGDTLTTCLDNWEQIQSLSQSVKNGS